jgi:hypothetical protein
MRRKLLALFWSLVAAGGIGAGLTVLNWDEGGEINLRTPTRLAAPGVPTAAPAVRPPPPPPAGAPAATVAPTPVPTASPPPTVDAKTINCDRTPTFCSQTAGSMVVQEDKLVEKRAASYPTDYANVPKTAMSWQILRPDGAEAHRGDAARKLIVRVSIFNATQRTFVFPHRQIVLVVERNGQTFHEIVTKGAAFEMTPGSRLNAGFEIPIAYDGDYRWRAKTWFYEEG